MGVNAVDMDISAGHLVVLKGNSGSGKSTLLSLLAGLDRPFRSGQVDPTSELQSQTWLSLLSRPYTLIPGEPLATGLNVEQGEFLGLVHAWQSQRLEIVGILDPEGLALAESGRVAITDIATFQEFTGSFGHVERIDLKLTEPMNPYTRQVLQ